MRASGHSAENKGGWDDTDKRRLPGRTGPRFDLMKRKESKMPKKANWLTLLVGAVFILSACTRAEAETSGSIASAASEPCPEVTPVPPTQGTAPQLIVELVDATISYKDYTRLALSQGVEVLRLIAGPGDQAFIAWIGLNPTDPATTVFQERVPLVPHQEYPSPVPTPTPLPDGVPNTAHPTRVRAQQAAFCEQAKRNNDALRITEKWRADQDIAAAEFRNKLEALKNTPLPKDPRSPICDSLWKAAEILSSPVEGRNWTRKKLLLWTDLEEYPPLGFERCRNLQLPDAQVVVAMWYCAETPRDCELRRDLWQQALQDAGAARVTVLRPEVSKPETIVALLNEEGR